jgi:hypothetical protein
MMASFIAKTIADSGLRNGPTSRPAPVAGRLGQPVTIPGARKELSEALIYTGYFRLPDC